MRKCKLTKDDLLCVFLCAGSMFLLWALLWMGSGEMETQSLIRDMGEETYEEIKSAIAAEKGILPTDAQIANYYVSHFHGRSY